MNDNLKYTEKNIVFNNVKSPDHFIPQGPIGIKDKYTINTTNRSIESIDENKNLINAIDIDWNGADMGDDTINTTADLLNYIKTKSGGNS